MKRRLVLVGPGLANLQVLRALARQAEVTLISEGTHHTYSGMLPGIVAGDYLPEEASIDLAALCHSVGARLEASPATELDLSRREVRLANGERVGFDVLSVNIGAALKGDDLPGVRQHATIIKPLALAPEALSKAAAPIVIAGAGLGAVELALVLRRRTTLETTLVSSTDRFTRLGRDLASAIQAELERAGVHLRLGRRVIAAQPHLALLDDGSRLPFGTLVWATGPRASPLLRASGAAVDDDGYLRVAATLQSPSHTFLFGAGDCVSIDGVDTLEKAGVFSIRQGPTLITNVLASLNETPARARYTPHQAPLQLVNLGDRRALGTWKGHLFRGRAAFWLKDFIDRRWIRQYQLRASDRASAL